MISPSFSVATARAAVMSWHAGDDELAKTQLVQALWTALLTGERVSKREADRLKAELLVAAGIDDGDAAA